DVSLIEAVNILGSLFYGVILGIFLVAFWLKNIGGKAVFISAIVSEIIILLIYNADIVSFLWLNVIGAMLVIAIGLLVQFVLAAAKKPS
ncbi:MAG TPA: sodium:solute symporter, partial [Chitinophagaceae bacterium]|nr:sodium:solute symporter [Chitinophagaceae bacterium]